MELLDPIEALEHWPQAAAKAPGESTQPQQLTDDPQIIARMIGRQNVSYDPVWNKAEEVYPKWLPVKCDTARRAILLASSGKQHRTRLFEVVRRGKLVCVRLVKSTEAVA